MKRKLTLLIHESTDDRNDLDVHFAGRWIKKGICVDHFLCASVPQELLSAEKRFIDIEFTVIHSTNVFIINVYVRFDKKKPEKTRATMH